MSGTTPGGPQRRPFDPGIPAAGLTRGDVLVTFRPVRDRVHADAVIAGVRRIRAVGSVAEQGLDHGELRLEVHVARPIPLGSELRRALPRELVSCTLRDGRYAVVLSGVAPRTAGPAHAAAPPPGPVASPPPGATAAAPPPGPAAPPPGPRPADVAGIPGPLAAVTRTGRPQGTSADPGVPPVPAVEVMAGALQSLTDVSIIAFDRDERIRAVTGTAHTEPDFLPEQMLGRPAADALAPNAWEALRPSFAAALAGETRVRDFGGRDGVTTFEATTSPVLSGAVVVGGMVVTRDVTARRRDQDLIAELREAFAMTFDHSPICQALLSPAAEWLRVNGALRDLLGRDEASLAGRPAREITHPDDVATEDGLLHEVREGRRDRYALQKRFLHADGRAVPVQLRMSAVRTTTGEIRGLLAQILDADVLTRGTDADAPPPLAH